MKRLFASLALATVLLVPAGCAKLTEILNTPVPAGTLEGLVTTANAAITTADGYIAYCMPNPAPAGCDDSFIQNQVFPDVEKLKSARNNAQSWIKANNGKTLAPATIYDALNTALNTVKNLGLAGAKK